MCLRHAQVYGSYQQIVFVGADVQVCRELTGRVVRALVVAAIAILMAALAVPVSAFAQSSDFSAWLDASPMSPAAGQNVAYTITVTNGGPDPASNASLVITPPPGTSFVSLSTPLGWISTTPAVGASGLITSNSGFMVPQAVAFTLVLQVGAGTAPGTNLLTEAAVSSPEPDPNPGNNIASVIVTVPNAPVAGPVSATVAYGSSNNPITLNIAGGAPTSVAVATAAAQGTASAAGTSITYTPANGYSGPDSFTYTATNASGTSAPATVTITVNPQPVSISPTSLSPMFVTVSFSESVTASGGTPPYTYNLTAGALPPGLSLDHDGTLSGTPTTAGNFAFTITATDSGGTPATGSRAYNVLVSPPSPPVANPASGTMGMDAGSIVITPTLGGGPATSLSVASVPSHGAVSIAGMSFTYTPATGYFGADSFTYTASGPGGASNVATVSITVTAPMAPSAHDVAATVAANSSANPIALDMSGGGAPTSVAVATAPAHGTASATGTSITYTPVAGYSGADSFTYTAINAGGTSAPATVSIIVAAPTLSLWAGPLPDALLGAAYGQAITATGGTAPYGFALSSGTLPAGMSLAASGLLSGTPATLGSYAFSVAATDAFGAVGVRAYVLTVTANPDAIRARFSELGQEFVQTRMTLLASGIDTPGLNSRTDLSGRPGTVKANTSGNSQVLGFAASLAEINAAGGAAEALAQGNAAGALPFNVWIDARMTLHARSQDAGHWGEFALTSIGADYLIEENLMAGVALHGDWMRDASVDSEVRGSGFLVGPYVSIGLDEGLTLDASLFYGRSWNDAAATVAGVAYSGNFETDRLLVKAKLEGTWQTDAMTIRPNATFVLSAEQAGAYTVSSAAGGAVFVPGFDNTDYRFGLGATFEYAYMLGNGIELTPQMGIGLAGGNSGTAAGPLSQGYGKLKVGLDLAAEAWTLGGKIEFDVDTTGRRALSAKGRLGLAF